jgi:hypothetical protein
MAVYMVLARMANNDSQSCFPSHTTIARILNIGRSTVIRTLEILQENGLIKIEHRTDEQNLKQSNIYFLLNLKKAKPASQDEPMCPTETTMYPTETRVVSVRNKGSITQTHKQYSLNNTILNNTTKRESENITSSSEEVTPDDISSFNSDCSFQETFFDLPSSRQSKQQEPTAAPPAKKREPKQPPKAVDPALSDERILTWRKYAVANECKYWPNTEQRVLILNEVVPNDENWELCIKWWLSKGLPHPEYSRPGRSLHSWPAAKLSSRAEGEHNHDQLATLSPAIADHPR